jgi:hypothetical protein
VSTLANGPKFILRINQNIGGHRQAGHIPLPTSSFEWLIRPFHDDDQIQVASNTPIAA